jgi:glycosyltransferase involved in cell wall biosynthesis
MNKIKYSLVICAYNEGLKIKNTINSIYSYSKNRDDIEIIIINDNSNDNTKEIIEQFDKVNLINNITNKGISYCRNKGVDVSKGKYIIFLDAHVLLETNIFKIYDKLFDKYNNIIGISGIYSSDSKQDNNSIRDIVRFVYRKKNQNDFIITYDNYTTLSSCIFCVERKVIIKNKFPTNFKGVAAEDIFLQLNLMENKYKILHTNKVKIRHVDNLSLGGLFKKIIYQSKGTHKLLSNAIKSGIKIPYSEFFLEFPLFLFISFYFSIIFSIIYGFSVYYIYFIVLSIVLDYYKLYKLFFFKASIRMKLKTVIYLFCNESIKIFDWPISIFRNKYNFIDIFKVLKLYLIWQVKKYLVV